jgi:uncharacterized membrane protein YbhN (UPF0104 family)
VNASLRRWSEWAIKIAVTVAVTYFLFRSLHLSWSEIAAVDGSWRPRPVPLTASVVALIAVFVYLVALWARMVKSFGGPTLGLWEAGRIFWMANLGRYVPGKVWQLAGLTYLAAKRGVRLPVATSSAVLHQIFALGAAAVVAGLALSLEATRGFPQELVPWALLFVALIALLTAVPSALRFMLRVAFRLGGKGAEAPRISAGFGAGWLALHIPSWVGYGLAFGLLWLTFPTLPGVVWPAAIGGFAAAYFLGYAAIFAPAGVGVREGALAVILAPWIGAAEAAVLAVIARIWMTAAELIPIAVIAALGGFRTLRITTDDNDADHEH